MIFFPELPDLDDDVVVTSAQPSKYRMPIPEGAEIIDISDDDEGYEGDIMERASKRSLLSRNVNYGYISLSIKNIILLLTKKNIFFSRLREDIDAPQSSQEDSLEDFFFNTFDVPGQPPVCAPPQQIDSNTQEGDVDNNDILIPPPLPFQIDQLGDGEDEYHYIIAPPTPFREYEESTAPFDIESQAHCEGKFNTSLKLSHHLYKAK